MRVILFLSFICFIITILAISGCTDKNVCENVENQLSDCKTKLDDSSKNCADQTRNLENELVAVKSERDFCWNQYMSEEGINVME